MRGLMGYQAVVVGAVVGWAVQADAKPKAAPAPPEPQPDVQEAAELERREGIAKEARAQLDGTVWTVEGKPYRATDSSAQPFSDELAFQDGKVSSKRFGAAGYASSAYSVNVQGSTPLWETMQVKEGEGTMTWSGELYGQAMGGIVTKRPSDPARPAEHFQFSGTLVSQAPPPTESREAGRGSPEGAARGTSTPPQAEPVAEPDASPTEGGEPPSPAAVEPVLPAPPTPAQDSPPASEPPKKRGWLW